LHSHPWAQITASAFVPKISHAFNHVLTGKD
jgi:hypothetical protein